MAAKESKQSKLQLFFLLVIPLLFAITIALLISTFVGFNVFDAAKQAIGLSSEKADDQIEEGRLDLQATIENQKQQIKQLENQLDEKDQQVADLEKDKKLLEARLEQRESESAEPRVDHAELAEMYGEMSPKNAAAIVAKLENTTAVEILKLLKTDKRADIMEKLPSEKAAELTQILYQE